MKKLFLLIFLCAWTASAQQSLTVTFSFSADEWSTLTNKLAVVNADLATKYAADMVTWEASASAARVLGQAEPQRPVLAVLNVDQYMKRFAAGQLGDTKRELRARDENGVIERMKGLSPVKLRLLEEFSKTLQ